MATGKGIMLLGTASDVGKTILCTALCRIFKQDGFKVAPFKAQNMTLNSFVTADQREIGIAQALQAKAAGVVPQVEMNPILLKPKADMESQVIVMGKPLQDMTAKSYRQEYIPRARQVVQDCLKFLQSEYEVLVAEGAGSAAEVNLKDGDIVNWAVAEMADLPVILVADIDRGGVFASIIGTLDLITPEERDRVVGLIINKFRGDIDLFHSGVEFLKERTGKPVLGVIPYLEHGIAEEDSTSISSYHPQPGEVEIAVLKLPRIANFADVHPLAHLSGISLRYVQGGEPIGNPQAVILPDTTNPIADLEYLKSKGYHVELTKLQAQSIPILGIGAGCYLLGETIHDPEGTPHPGLGLLPLTTALGEDARTTRVDSVVTSVQGEMWKGLSNIKIRGYELSIGEITFTPEVQFFVETGDGAALFGTPDGQVLGTQIHEIFNNKELLLAFVNRLRRSKELPPLSIEHCRALDQEEAFDRLAAEVRKYLDVPLLYRLMGLSPSDQKC